MPGEPTDCPVCGSTHVTWRRCKLVCERCGSIVMSCADLLAGDPSAAEPFLGRTRAA